MLEDLRDYGLVWQREVVISFNTTASHILNATRVNSHHHGGSVPLV